MGHTVALKSLTVIFCCLFVQVNPRRGASGFCGLKLWTWSSYHHQRVAVNGHICSQVVDIVVMDLVQKTAMCAVLRSQGLEVQSILMDHILCRRRFAVPAGVEVISIPIWNSFAFQSVVQEIPPFLPFPRHFSNGEIAVFPLGMAILNLTDLHHVERPPLFFASCFVLIFWTSWYWVFFYMYGRINDTWNVMPATQLLINTTWFSLPRDIGTPSAQGGDRAPTREPAKGTDPRNGIFQVSPRASSAVSPLPGSWPSRSWRLRRPG